MAENKITSSESSTVPKMREVQSIRKDQWKSHGRAKRTGGCTRCACYADGNRKKRGAREKGCRQNAR
ncbi:hypothetical protein AAUPMB_18176 [Pasteurella multocida subsp. multocida str. Anand1_buffalo]|nr:hypothetical protein AAUPMB_18176 [Pasteurella multocida subsp. multocida str. Anand1_buffalo]